jgi:hypothetical protein
VKRTICVGIALAAFTLAGCDEPESTSTVSCYLGTDVIETSGDAVLDYDGFVGRVPQSIPLVVTLEETERLFFRGCAYDGDDAWGIEVDVQVAADVELPAPFEVRDPAAAHVDVLLSRCPDGSCAGGRRTWFGGGPSEILVEGLLRSFDPAGGRLDLSAILVDVSPGTLETSPLQISTDLSWTPKYEHKISASLDGHWIVEARGSSSETLYFDLLQTGGALSGSLCDADWNCTESDLSGVVADPTIRLRWTEDPEGDALERKLHATVQPDGKSFKGTLADDESAPVAVDMERE